MAGKNDKIIIGVVVSVTVLVLAATGFIFYQGSKKKKEKKAIANTIRQQALRSGATKSQAEKQAVISMVAPEKRAQAEKEIQKITVGKTEEQAVKAIQEYQKKVEEDEGVLSTLKTGVSSLLGYVNSLNSKQKENIAIIKDEARKAGITNPYAIAAMLAIVSKESELIPKNENLKYSAKRLQEVFKLSPERANMLAGKPEEIGNAIYGGWYGNSANEGYKYRGRGFNQLTFKGNYEKYSKSANVDIVSNPDALNNDSRVAAKVLIAFNKDGIKSLASQGKLKEYNATNINDFKNEKDAVLAFYHATAGSGKDVSYIKSLYQKDTLGGMAKAISRVNDLLDYINKLT